MMNAEQLREMAIKAKAEEDKKLNERAMAWCDDITERAMAMAKLGCRTCEVSNAPKILQDKIFKILEDNGFVVTSKEEAKLQLAW